MDIGNNLLVIRDAIEVDHPSIDLRTPVNKFADPNFNLAIVRPISIKADGILTLETERADTKFNLAMNSLPTGPFLIAPKTEPVNIVFNSTITTLDIIEADLTSISLNPIISSPT